MSQSFLGFGTLVAIALSALTDSSWAALGVGLPAAIVMGSAVSELTKGQMPVGPYGTDTEPHPPKI